jgi:hypothetical protein
VKLDKFLARLFSKRVLIFVLLLAFILCTTACQFTMNDVLCLVFCGCLSPGTIGNCIKENGFCGCRYFCEGDGSGGENPSCAAQCIDCTYGRVCDCILGEITQPQCAPSRICDSCGCGEEEP